MTKYTQPACLDERLRKGDKEFLYVPLIDHSVTYNEFHALVLGTIGLILGEKGLALKTVLHEFWWFVFSFSISYLIGRYLRT